MPSVNEEIIAQDKLVEHPYLTLYTIKGIGGLLVDLLDVAIDKAIIQSCKMWMKIAKTKVTTKQGDEETITIHILPKYRKTANISRTLMQ